MEEIIMIGKNNKRLKELKNGVRVETYSIKKFKFGAASIVIGASIFFGTGVASANEIAASSDNSEVNGTNAKSGNDDKLPEKINTVSAKKESVTSVNKPSNVKEENTKVEVEKKVVDKSLLETNITKLEELLATVNKDKAPASTLSAVNVDLINAKSILENANASQEEVDALVKKLRQQTQIVSSMPKVTSKEKEVKEGANTIANSGSHDSRNGQSMGEGTQFRATTVEYGRVENALINVKEYISEAKGQGTTTIGNRDRTISKTFMTAKYSEENGKKFITYDVYFQNDGKALDGVTNNTFWFYPPRDILYGSGEYPVGTIYEAYYERYRNDAGTGTLSHNPNNFTKVGNTYNIPLKKYVYQDSGARQSWNDRNLLYQLDGGPARNSQRQEMLKNLEGNSELNSIIKSKLVDSLLCNFI